MQPSVFEFLSYKAYLESKVGPRSQRRGVKGAMAKALNCQATYVSQVLNGAAQFSLEQADILNVFFGHAKDEAAFFLLLTQYERAGTVSLRAHFQTQIDEALKKRMVLTERLGQRNDLSEEDRVRYYSSWHFAAIHIATTIPSLQTRAALAEFFKLPLKKVSDVLSFLNRTGLLKEVRPGEFKPGETLIRLGNDSPNIVRHHSNWRMAAMESLDREELGDLHYSGVVSLSKKDAARIKDRLLEHLKKDLETIRASTEEELYAYNLDFFNLRR